MIDLRLRANHLRRPSAAPRPGSKLGQSLVEFALLLPVLLLIVLFALDFGRVYMGWITINGMARIGANYAALHPDAWTSPGDAEARATYLTLMTRSAGALDCALIPPPPPSFPEGRKVGNPADVRVDCMFAVAAPVISAIVGDLLRVSASSSFPITYGCLAGCPPPPPDTLPPPPVGHCRDVPTMVGLSLEGAEATWVQAGFLGENVDKPATAVPTDTVATAVVTPPPDAEFCPIGEAFFSSTVSLTAETVDEPTTVSCLALPNVRGMTVGAARTAWGSSEFLGTFTPAMDFGSYIVVAQTATPAADPGDCVERDTSLAVAYGSPPPEPPPPPCMVPGFVDWDTSLARGMWTAADFEGVPDFKQNEPYKIKSQTLVGGTWVSCTSRIVLSKN